MSTAGATMSSASRELSPEGRREIEPSEVFEDPRGSGAWLDVGLRQSRYTSPLPSPDDLDRYMAQLSDVAERLMAAGEREQAHRHQLENRYVTIEEETVPRFYAGQRRAQMIGLILGLVFLGVVAIAVLRGYPLLGAGAAASGIAAVVWALRRDPASAGGRTQERVAGKGRSVGG